MPLDKDTKPVALRGSKTATGYCTERKSCGSLLLTIRIDFHTLILERKRNSFVKCHNIQPPTTR